MERMSLIVKEKTRNNGMFAFVYNASVYPAVILCILLIIHFT